MSAAAIVRINNGDPMTGLFLVHQDAALKPVLDMLELVWFASEAEEWHNQIVYLPFK